MQKGDEYPRTEEFIRYAASCGIPVTHHGNHRAIVPGSDLVISTIKPEYVHYRRRLPPIVVGLYAVMAGSPDLNSGYQERLFEGKVKDSMNPGIKRGDNIIGLASLGCQAMIVNTSNPEDLAHILETFGDSSYLGHVIL